MALLPSHSGRDNDKPAFDLLPSRSKGFIILCAAEDACSPAPYNNIFDMYAVDIALVNIWKLHLPAIVRELRLGYVPELALWRL
jgi:hypothetical protein